MPHYKDTNNNLHFIENEEYRYLLPPDCVQLTDEEANAIQHPPLTLDEIKAKKLAELAAYRYEKETAGITLNGVKIKADRESQAMITGAKAYFDLNESATIDWKGENGWVRMDRAAILAISQAVAAHVQECFSNEKVHADAISALSTIADIKAYDITTGWPG